MMKDKDEIIKSLGIGNSLLDIECSEIFIQTNP